MFGPGKLHTRVRLRPYAEPLRETGSRCALCGIEIDYRKATGKGDTRGYLHMGMETPWPDQEVLTTRCALR